MSKLPHDPRPDGQTSEAGSSRTLQRAAFAIFLLGLLAGFGSGIRKWLLDKPDWTYFRNYVENPLWETSGPDKMMFGYLPGFRAILTPFVALGAPGYLLFALLNAASCAAVLAIVWRREKAGRNEPWAALWLAICSFVPVIFALQNNQIVAPAVYLALVGLALARRGKWVSGGAAFALGVLVKSLPLPVLGYAVLAGHWRMVVVASAALVLGSLGLAALTDGWQESLRHHRAYPAQVSAQSPLRAIDPETAPKSFGNNRSPGAELVRLARATGVPAFAALHVVLAAGSLVLLSVLTIRGGSHPDLLWPRVAAWLAWVAAAAPFGRYYYLLFLVPALYAAGLHLLARAGRHRGRCLAGLVVFSPALFLVRSPNSGYALLSVALVVASFLRLGAEVGRARRESADLSG